MASVDLFGMPDLAAMQQEWMLQFNDSSACHTSDLMVGSAPGRINLIGEHTDYSEGFVFPCGLGLRAAMVFKSRNDSKIRVWASDIKELGHCDLASAALERKSEMAKFLYYTAGVGVQLQQALGSTIFGFDAVLSSTIPIGGGVSSSSALAVVSGRIFWAINPNVQSNLTRDKFFNCICEGEWQWSGVRGGIMDQYTSLNCLSNECFVLDCRTGAPLPRYSHVRLPSGLAVMVANTNVKHELVGSPYNERRAACERATAFIQRYLAQAGSSQQVTHLRDVDLPLLFRAVESVQNGALAMDAIAYRRAYHVITENARTLNFAVALENLDFITAGELVNQSHNSLRDEFQVSCEELDAMVEIARSIPQVLGARMMGGGFGGCCVILVNGAHHVAEVSQLLSQRYEKQTGIKPTLMQGSGGHGAHVESYDNAVVKTPSSSL
jgi:galactokinase